LMMPKHQNGDGQRVDDHVEPNSGAERRHEGDLTLRFVVLGAGFRGWVRILGSGPAPST
jgi:hypothetical protein